MIDDARKEAISKTVLFVTGAMDAFMEHGLIENDNGTAVTPRGRAAFDQLHASGFRPPREMIRAAVDACCKQLFGDGTDEETRNALVTLIDNYDEIMLGKLAPIDRGTQGLIERAEQEQKKNPTTERCPLCGTSPPCVMDCR